MRVVAPVLGQVQVLALMQEGVWEQRAVGMHQTRLRLLARLPMHHLNRHRRKQSETQRRP